MAVNQINQNDFLRPGVMNTKGSEKTKKAETKEAVAVEEKYAEDKNVQDKVDFKAQTMSLNKEAADSKIRNRDEAEQMMMSVKKLATEKPENTISVHANIAPDAALQLLMQ